MCEGLLKVSATSVETLTALARGHGTGKLWYSQFFNDHVGCVSVPTAQHKQERNKNKRRLGSQRQTEVRVAVLLKAGVPSWWMACRRGDVRVGGGGKGGGGTTFQVDPLLSA